MKASLRAGWAAFFWVCLALTVAVVGAPDTIAPPPARRTENFQPPSWYERSADGRFHVLGTDYLGRSFLPILCKATSGTVRIAVLGTAAVVIGCLAIGVVHGATRSRSIEALVAAGNLGVMAVPEAAVLITLATAWPRLAPALLVNASMVAVLVFFAVPTGARLIAERVRAVGKTGFVAASRAYGATYPYIFRHDVWPHLIEDVAWITASVLPRFVAIEVGMAYLGVEYRNFEGLGRALAKSFSYFTVGTAVFQMFVTIAVVLWVALLPQVLLRVMGVRASRGLPT